jgi:hypothetical protein
MIAFCCLGSRTTLLGSQALACSVVLTAQVPIIASGYIKPIGLELPFQLLLACGNSNLYRLDCVMHQLHTRLVQMVLEGISYDEALSYLDDIGIHSKDIEGHYVAMRKVFDPYRRAGLKIQPSKYRLFQAKIEYLGHFIYKDSISPVPKYVQVVQI